ncbi:MAG: hypothetical protein HC899_40240 [Leptolyngbyaceae cyanobacterium SM1_4_3]|nr:hypothetical protein [Leptolyngbyaceae cyanobacterium SM1_4_3]
MHCPLKILSTATLARFVFTAIVLFPSHMALTAINTHTDPDQVTTTLTAQDVRPIEPFRGIDRG